MEEPPGSGAPTFWYWRWQTSARCSPVTTPRRAASRCRSSPITVAISSTHSSWGERRAAVGAWAQRGPCIPHPPAESERFYLKKNKKNKHIMSIWRLFFSGLELSREGSKCCRGHLGASFPPSPTPPGCFQPSTPAPNQLGAPFPALPSPVSLLTLNPATAPDCKSDSMLPGSR